MAKRWAWGWEHLPAPTSGCGGGPETRQTRVLPSLPRLRCPLFTLPLSPDLPRIEEVAALGEEAFPSVVSEESTPSDLENPVGPAHSLPPALEWNLGPGVARGSLPRPESSRDI